MHPIPRQEVVSAVLRHGGIREEIDLGTSTSLGRERTASPARIVFGARGIDVLAESLVAIVGTGEIRLAGVVWEESLGFGKLVNLYVRIGAPKNQ